jgi:anti-sigma B factor antagonist
MDDVTSIDSETAQVGSQVRISEALDTDGTVVLQLVGELDLSSVDSVRSVTDRVIDRGASAIVFDLNGLDFMDSSGIALLLTVADQVERTSIREPSAIVRRIIEVTGLATTLSITP